MEVVASLSQDLTAAAQCGLFTYKSVPVIFEPPCIKQFWKEKLNSEVKHRTQYTATSHASITKTIVY